MAVKCSFNNFGFCKFEEECRFEHPIEVCRVTSCQTRNCLKRHPKACRNHFLKKHCRFGKNCKYDHFFDCESCENLKYMIQKEEQLADKRLKEKDEAIALMASEIQNLKKDKVILEKKVKVSRNENEKLLVEIRKENAEKRRLKDKISALSSENEGLEKAVKETKEDTVESKESQKMKDIKAVNMKILKENYSLKANLERITFTLKENMDSFEQKIKVKDEKVKSLLISVDNFAKLKETNQKLEISNEDLKKKMGEFKDAELPFPCDRCGLNFKTAGLLVKHVKTHHETMPRTRP